MEKETKCRVCGGQTKTIFQRMVLNKYQVDYQHCTSCGFLQTETPHWLDEAYGSVINYSDTGVLVRNLKYAKVVASILRFCFNQRGKYIDYAGGYGVFTRLMRDQGFDYWHQDPYATNLLARGFEAKDDEKFDLLTTFECLEHLVNPEEELEKMLKYSKNVFASTVVLPQPIPKPGQWFYYAFEHGQHIAFYSVESLQRLANMHGLFLNSFRNFHMFTEKPIPRWKYLFSIALAKFLPMQWLSTGLTPKTYGDSVSMLSHDALEHRG